MAKAFDDGLLLSETDLPQVIPADPPGEVAAGGPADVAKLAAKLLAVMGQLGTVKRTGWNKHLGKDYSTMADIIEAIQKPLIHHGILAVPDVLLTERYEIETRKKDGRDDAEKRQAQDVVMRIQFIDAATGAVISFRAAGTGMDSGDKAAVIAQTTAFRNGLRAIFLIYDDDPGDLNGKEASERGKRKQQPAAQREQPAGTAPPCPKCNVPTEWKDGKFLCPTCHARVLA